SSSAAPAERLAVDPGVLVETAEMCVLCERLPLDPVVSIDAAENQLLPRSDIEFALTTIPGAREHHRLRFRDLEVPVGVEICGHCQRIPMELALGICGRWKADEERRESQHAHRARLHGSVFLDRKL